MAFDLESLTKDANSSGSFHHYQYVTDDTKAVTMGANYFLEAYTKLRVGSHITVVASDSIHITKVIASTHSGVTTSEAALSSASTDGYEDLKPTGEYSASGASSPTGKSFRGDHYLEAFSVGDKATYKFHLTHDLIAGSDLYAHVHWSNNQASPTGTVNWRTTMSYARGYKLGQFDTDIVKDFGGDTGVQYDHMIEESTAITSTDVGEDIQTDGVIILTLERLAGTNTDDAFLIEVDLHYHSDGKKTIERNEDGSGWTKV